MRKYIQKSIGQSLVQINCHRTPFSLLLLTQYNSELLNNNRGLQKELWNKVKWQICLGQKDRGNSITRRNVVAIVINRRLQNVVLRCNLKNDRMISVHFLGKPFNTMVTQVYALKSNTEEAKVEWFCEDLQDLLELTPKKRCPFHYREQNAKVESQETPGVTGKFGLGVKNEARQSLIEFFQENTLVIANNYFQQHKRRLYTCASPDGQHQNQIDYILCTQRWRISIQSAKNKLTVAQIMNPWVPNSDLNWRE